MTTRKLDKAESVLLLLAQLALLIMTIARQ